MKLITVKDVANILGAKPSTIYYWVETRQIPFLKINGLLRFEEEVILNWIMKCRHDPHPVYNNSAGRRSKKGG